MSMSGLRQLTLEGFRARALKKAADFAYNARRMQDRVQILEKMVATFADIFIADSVLYYDLNTSGRLKAHTANNPEFVGKSHIQDVNPEGPLKTVMDNEGFVFVPTILQPASYLLLDKDRNLVHADYNPLDPEVVRQYLAEFGEGYEQTGAQMSIGFGCLSVPGNKFGAFKIDSFSSGSSLLPGGMSPAELLDVFSLVTAFASQELDAIDLRMAAENQALETQRNLEDIRTMGMGARHAVANMLSKAQLGIDIARMHPDSPKAKKALDLVKAYTDSAVNNLDDYFAPLRKGTFKMKVNPRKTGLPDIINEAENMFCLEKESEGQETSVRIVIKGEMPESIITDKAKILDVINELVNNAKKYSPQGSSISVIFEVVELGDGIKELKVSVVDQGVGVSADQIQRLFKEKDVRFHPELNRGNSSGNGLYVCDKIIKMLGGRMEVISEVGKGSTFSFTHPIIEI